MGTDIRDFLSFDNTSINVELTERINKALDSNKSVCVYGTKCRDGLHVNSTNLVIPYKNQTPYQPQGERVIATIDHLGVRAWKLLQDCCWVECEGTVDFEGKFSGDFPVSFILMSNNLPKNVTCVVPADMRDGAITNPDTVSTYRIDVAVLNEFENTDDLFGFHKLDAQDKITSLLKDGHRVCVYGKSYSDYLHVAGTDLKLPYREGTKPTSANGEKVMAIINSTEVLCWIASDATTSTYEADMYGRLIGEFDVPVYTYSRNANSKRTFAVDAAMQGEAWCCPITGKAFKYSAVVLTDFQDGTVANDLEGRIKEWLADGKAVMSNGYWSGNRFTLAGTGIVARCRQSSYIDKERAVAIVRGEEVHAIQSLDGCSTKTRLVEIDSDGFVQSSGHYHRHSIITRKENAWRSSLCAADYLWDGNMDGMFADFAVIVDFEEDASVQQDFTVNDIVDYIMSKLPASSVSGLSEQEKINMAMDTIRKFI